MSSRVSRTYESKDAYMLVYSRRAARATPPESEAPLLSASVLPPNVKSEITSLNDKFASSLVDYDQKCVAELVIPLTFVRLTCHVVGKRHCEKDSQMIAP